ncbi:uncharacterized protein EDB91DRAFT_1154804 [Suillus paluster]|uniref:uncharacterized protein n=1 Tax=Suillus paluster TaxID=48578 RepID=UPI001B869DA8|nr:uncharacterized protein EDB91DRAFT_214468 [Suillus paluster]XP_041173371.1 uncharacterized protein EDB91DRAFT_1154804 [Suillus paluster]KAG1722333.1 hypothetical protein EDB91DRAFT_214468 [Suillus paluster]KAG1731176.1 hypothetical protein EDB91DRAFT_1154804 [Suillus paluster]
MIPNSVSALKSRRRASIATLPPELWEIIFDHATYVPSIFIPEIYEHSGSLGSHFNRDHHPLIRQALVTKRYLVRVCKKWWHLATPFLYRSIFIGRGRCLLSLASALALSACGKGVLLGERSLGSYTERLDIAMRDKSQAHGDADLDLLAEVILCLPNLAIVSVAVTPSQYRSLSMPDTVMDALTDVAPSLKIIDWASHCLLPSFHSLQDLVITTQQLHILHCPYFVVGQTDAMANCILSSCTTLTVPANDIFSHMSSTQLPALRELVFRSFSVESDPLFIPSLERHGGKLRSVHLHWAGYLSQINPLLAMHCPHLRRLTITLDSWESFDIESIKPLPVEYLGLRYLQGQLSKRNYTFVFSVLAHLKDAMPTLRTIRFTGSSNVNDLLKNHHKTLIRALELFDGSKLRLEDHEGRLLSDRVVPLDATS